MKIIVTGCRGQLGTEILKQLREGRSEIGPIPLTIVKLNSNFNIFQSIACF